MLSALRVGARGGYRIWGLQTIGPSKLKVIHLPTFATRGLSQVSSLSSEFDVQELIVNIKEPTLSSLGLANNTPAGFVQSSLEYLHINMDVPWWGAIMIGTVCVRLALFPLVVKARRDGAKFNNSMPGAMVIQNKFNQARQAGDLEMASKYSIELNKYMKSNSVNPLKTMLAPLAQFPFFISFFIGLRGMATLPVESMKHGGLFWFENLTVADPTFILPIFTSATMYMTIITGVDTGKIPNETIMRIMKLMPFFMLPFTIQFPAGILCYWATSNFFTLMQVGFLKLPAVRKYFNIPEMIEVPKAKSSFMGGTFMKEAKESYINLKVAKEMEERRSLEELIERKKEEIRRKRGDKQNS